MPPLISRVDVLPHGSAGRREILVELPRQVPDGLALDMAGNLCISLDNPNIIYRLTPEGQLETLYDGWEQLMLVALTSVDFGGPGMKTPIIASLCGWSVHIAQMEIPGLALRYQRVIA